MRRLGRDASHGLPRRTSLDRLFQGIEPDQQAAVLGEEVHQQPALDRGDDEQHRREDQRDRLSGGEVIEPADEARARVVPAESNQQGRDESEHAVADQGRNTRWLGVELAKAVAIGRPSLREVVAESRQ